MATSTRRRSKWRALAGLDVGHAGLDALLEPLVGERDQPRVGQHHLTAAGDVLAGLRALGEDAEHDLGEVVDQVAVGSAGAEGLEQLGAEHGRAAEDGVVLAGEVVEQRAPGDPGQLGEVVHGEPVEPSLEGEPLRAAGDPVRGEPALLRAGIPLLQHLDCTLRHRVHCCTLIGAECKSRPGSASATVAMPGRGSPRRDAPARPARRRCGCASPPRRRPPRRRR